MISTFTFLLMIKLVYSLDEEIHSFTNKNNASSHPFHENILCRNCGEDVTFSGSIVPKLSPQSRYSYYDYIFNQDKVLVQVVMSDLFLHLPLITTNHSNCVGITEWELADSWFPGYRWKPCICLECGALVGWVFESIDPEVVDHHKTFFGLILTSLIGESSATEIHFNCEAGTVHMIQPGERHTENGCAMHQKMNRVLDVSIFCHYNYKKEELFNDFNRYTKMAEAASLSAADKEFLAQCEEQFKDRYTEKDEEFMKVHSADPHIPPIIESWWAPQNSGRRFDRRFNRRSHPYEKNNDRRSGYNNEYDNDRGYGYRNRRY